MTLLIVILLIAAAASGVLWSVLEVAFWIALVFFLAISALVVVGYLTIRRRTS